ncbi:LCP family protein [Nocardiopsis coralliicola]
MPAEPDDASANGDPARPDGGARNPDGPAAGAPAPDAESPAAAESTDTASGATDTDTGKAESETETRSATGADSTAADASAAPGAESAAGTAATGSHPAPRKRRRGRIAAWTAVGLVLVLTAGAGGAAAYFRSLRSDMVQHDLGSALVEEERPEKIGDDLNILFIGSDGREDGNAEYGGKDFAGERSDSLMLAHISPDSRVTVVNFPRDSLVQLPECGEYGETEGTAPYYGMINAALFHGGPPCVVKTIESLTDIRIDHFAHLSFVGFRDMVDAVGGVTMCIPEPMEDERAKLDLDAGEQRLDGEESLAFVRARYEIGDGGDIGRIDRQQMFLGALAEEATGSDVLSDPGKLDGLLRAVTAHTATDDDLVFSEMVSIGATLAETDLTDIEFYTVPWTTAPFDPNRVVWREDDAARLFTSIREDRPIDADLESNGADPSASPSPSPSASPEADREPGDAGPAGFDGGAAFTPVALDEDGEGADEDSIEGRDATADPCSDGLGEGTDEEGGGQPAD